MLSNNGLENVGEACDTKSPEQPLNRACEFCRSLKVRCIIDNESSSQQCQRCYKAKRSCVFAPPQKRRQRKRTDARVAELEREVRAMRSLLKDGRASPLGAPRRQEQSAKHGSQSSHDTTSMGGRKASTPAGTESGSEEGLHHLDHSSSAETQSRSPSLGLDPKNVTIGGDQDVHNKAGSLDVIDRGIISLDMAEDLLAIYTNELNCHYPGLVVLHGSHSAHALRQEKPVLFLAILAAASLGEDPRLAKTLHEEITRVIAEKVIISGIKSLELVQSLLVTVWYSYPPESPANLQFYQYSHLAATMAYDLGIASKPRTNRSAIWVVEQRALDESDQAERSRTILSCYLLSATLAMTLRRQNMLTFNKWMQVCLDGLGKSPRPEDQALVSLIKLQRIADETLVSFGFDDPSTSISLTESVVQAIIKGFERQVEDWRKAMAPELMNLSMNIHYHTIKYNMYVFAMDGGEHDAQEFKHQYLSLPVLEEDLSSKARLRGPFSILQVNGTMKCIGTLHTKLDLILAIDQQEMRRIPNFFFARAATSLMALLNIWFLTVTTSLGEMIEPQNLKQGQYLADVIRKMETAVGPENRIIPRHWLMVVSKLNDWHNSCQKWLEKRFNKASENLQALPNMDQRQQMSWGNTTFESAHQSQEASGSDNNLGSSTTWLPEYNFLQNGQLPQGQNSNNILPELASMDMADYQTAWGLDELSIPNQNADFNGWMLDGIIPSNMFHG